MRIDDRLSRLAVIVAVSALAAPGCRSTAATKQRYIESGNRYADAGRYAEAAIEYRNALQYDARAAEVHVKLAEVLLRLDNYANALQEYVRAADLAPEDEALQLKTSSFLLVAGRFDDAKARAEKVLARNARSIDAQIVVANALAGLKDVDAAVAQIEDALRVDPDRSASYSNLGALEMGRGNRESAQKAFVKAISLEPRSINAHLALANFYWVTEQWTGAEGALRRAVEIDPRSPLANRALANFYLATNRRAEAEAPLKAVFEATKGQAAAIALAEYYIAIANETAARAILEPMLSDPRMRSEADIRLAALDYRNGRSAEAYRRLNEVLTNDSVNLQALIARSSFLLADHKLDESLKSAMAATNRHPSSTAAYFALGRVQTARSQTDAAIAAYQEVLRLNPRATAAKIALAQLHLAEGRPNSSVVFAQEALANEPSNGDAQLVYVRALLTQGELQRAEFELKQLVARFPKSAEVQTQMGMLLGRKHENAAARTRFERALELEPDHTEAVAGLVALDLSAKNHAAARARADALVGARSTAPNLALAGRTYASTGEFSAAEALLRRAIDQDSSYLPAYAALGQLYVVQGRLDAARAEFEAFVQRSPKSIAALTMLGVIEQSKGNIKGARDRFEQVLQIDPEAAVAANNLAWIYGEDGGNLDVALQLAQTARRRLPDAAEVNDTLGIIYYKKNLAPSAVAALRVSAEKDPTNPLYHYHLGLAYAKAGDTARAAQALQRALALKPDFDGAQDARSLLTTLKTP
jgi:tetratricopeptide (TPR) repeat protein